MADVDWPVGLPQYFQQQGYSEGNPDNLIVNQMDRGPSKRRQRSSAGYQPITGQMILTEAERQAFRDFYKNDIHYGATPFNMPLPGGDTADAFLNSQTIVPISGTSWRLTMALQVLF